MTATETVLQALADQQRAADGQRVAAATAPLAELVARAVSEATALEAIDRAPIERHRQMLEDPVWTRRREYHTTVALVKQIAEIEGLLANAAVLRRLVAAVGTVTAAEIARHRGVGGWPVGWRLQVEPYLSSAWGVAERLAALEVHVADVLRRAEAGTVTPLGEPAPMPSVAAPAPAFAESQTRQP